MGLASQLVDLNITKLEPQWAAWKSGSFLLPGTTSTGIITDQAKKAAALYYKLAGEWYDVATRVMQTDNGTPEFLQLSKWIDTTVKQRTAVEPIALPYPLDVAEETFYNEVSGKLKAIKDGLLGLSKLIPPAGTIPLVLILAIIFLLKK